jgi:hypothetical protein
VMVGPLGFECRPQWPLVATPAYSTQLLSPFLLIYVNMRFLPTMKRLMK